MANSRKSKSSDLQDRVAAVLARHVFPRAHLKLGFSGGVDSTVLLDVLATLAPQFPFSLSCLHVHHGLSPNADGWARFARSTAKAYGVPCMVKRVDIHANRKLGIEAAARKARYEVFAAAKADFILSAQHEDDQAETLVLQLLRGAGLSGLAAMPELREFAPGKKLLRPMLGLSRAQIERYAEQHQLAWVEDESNRDTAFARNYVRHEVLPRLQQLNSAACANLARTAAHLGEAKALLDELAAADLESWGETGMLKLEAFECLSRPRAGNLLRFWLNARGAGVPNSAELEEAVRQLLSARSDAQVRLRLNGMLLRRFKKRAWLEPFDAFSGLDGFVSTWNGEKKWPLSALGGSFHFERSVGEGIALRVLDDPSRVQVRLRQGGERFRPDSGRPRRSLKKLFQEQGIAPWERDRLPLLFSEEALVFVPGIGVAAEAQAQPGEAALKARWLAE
ncbi:MAG TPA: tRNA lysidine(34) synthetase TilS [Burkholderiales bacterium]|nr:tRNA lysidine(34) synthetase TilS [Burkholderiales bacterium]